MNSHLVLFAEKLDESGIQDLAPPIQIALFLGAMSLLTAALVSMTAFTRIIIVLSFVRRALATNEIPPNPVLIGLSLFLTLFVMSPTLNDINIKAIQPYLVAQQKQKEAPDKYPVAEFTMQDSFNAASHELKMFMLPRTRESDLSLFIEMAGDGEIQDEDSLPMRTLVPAFIISELKTAFIMGFCVFIPFLLIDLVVATILMSLGMMMMTPTVISTPCKLLLFVLVDGWVLIARGLAASFEVNV
jgi:flagellar biosynthesis protein FliP